MEPIVETTAGAVRGHGRDGVAEFLGIPYAADPVGKLRWMPPVPPEPWAGVRDADTWGPTPPQLPTPLTYGLPDQGEGCLHLSVWTPAADGGRRPVMVWIHGGGFSTMAASDAAWHGHRMAASGDVVVVGVEYRTGCLGFLDLSGAFGDDYAGSGNLGIRDQIAALEWVRDNVAAFGGDPGNVTIFGESAGGMSVGTLLATPAAGGLFHKAIAESGAASMVSSPGLAAAVGEHFLELAGVAPGDRGALEALPVDAILAAQANLFAGYPRLAHEHGDGEPLGLPTRPVVDGVVVPREPLDAIRDGAGAGIPLMLGTTRDEFRLFTEIIKVRVPTDVAHLTRRLARSLGPDRAAVAAEHYMAKYAAEHEHFGGAAAATDAVFTIPAVRLAEAQAAHEARTFLYRFDWPTTLLEGRLGACHGIEMPFVFDIFDGSPISMLAGADAPVALAKAMQSAWVAFARSGDPGVDVLPDWSRYDSSRRATMLFDTECRVADDPGAAERELWDGVDP